MIDYIPLGSELRPLQTLNHSGAVSSLLKTLVMNAANIGVIILHKQLYGDYFISHEIRIPNELISTIHGNLRVPPPRSKALLGDY